MKAFLTRIQVVVGALALMAAVAVTVPAVAQQPTQVNPTASSVQERDLLRQMRRIDGRCTLPDQKACLLEQPAGRNWREFHQATLPWIGGVMILGIVALLAVFYLMRGRLRVEEGFSGKTILRFNAFERFVHWMTAICFIILGLSGLNISFGKTLLLPFVGPESFTAVSQWGKYAHNYLSFPFTLGVILTFLMWIPWNMPSKADVEWLKKGGGMVGHEHPPAGKFNAGQKLLYWFVAIASVAIAITGYLLMFPFYGTTIVGMQLAQIVHAVVAMMFIALIIAHIYIGTLGMEAAIDAMWDGKVDENWAKQHHSLWYEEEKGKGHIVGAPPAGGRMQPAE
jgi:formate dehydrogenase subunit gamma